MIRNIPISEQQIQTTKSYLRKRRVRVCLLRLETEALRLRFGNSYRSVPSSSGYVMVTYLCKISHTHKSEKEKSDGAQTYDKRLQEADWEDHQLCNLQSSDEYRHTVGK